ncbi:uncharacterized protein G2W53_019917 [Senna tora]|uniref:Uncharacterized protein n=1 Tax=Senna tora TaxID=362788 RepID=A0A834WPM7_9FABA|nr:uncharacterized protein G2W53_019917 [Senna tora]
MIRHHEDPLKFYASCSDDLRENLDLEQHTARQEYWISLLEDKLNGSTISVQIHKKVKASKSLRPSNMWGSHLSSIFTAEQLSASHYQNNY